MIQRLTNLGNGEATEGFIVLFSDSYSFVPFMKPLVVFERVCQFGIGHPTSLCELIIGVLLVLCKGVRISFLWTM